MSRGRDRLRLEKHKFLVKGAPKRRFGQGVMSEAVEPVSQENRLSPEFCDLIYEWDPEAANDDYYVTSSDFIQLHSQIKKDLIRGLLWWATIVCLAMSGLAFVFR